ncbi:hypothetical protein GMOD_00002676 [Pyrenophora seminiperda CCB06]|uniref:Piwi domain-containing protein n=1 Tax=Pyrenophora seminiperda CCB06 TaxID=1302712 RepID=A0A3M7M2R5_9PLEO|nr:hypothetical protein GMOD_00002676 [Pyrenophora seminiperda CCB06]
MSARIRRDAITTCLQGLSVDAFFQLSQKPAPRSVENEEATIPNDHLIYFASDHNRLHTRPNEDIPAYIVAAINEKDRLTRQPIWCSRDLGKQYTLDSQGTNKSEYWKKVQLLVRQFIQTASVGSSFDTHVSCTRTGVLLREADKKKHSAYKFDDGRVTLLETSKVIVLFRTIVKLDPNGRKIHVETDLVPGVNGGILVSELMASAFGLSIVDSDNHDRVAKARAMLVGLRVVRTYPRAKGPGSASNAAATGLSHEKGPITISPNSRPPLSDITLTVHNERGVATKQGSRKQHSSEEFPDSIIVDVKPAAEVPNFRIDGSLKFPNMPLANIGKNSWVPLELLKTVGTSKDLQEIPAIGYMTASLQERRARYKIEQNEEKLLKADMELIEKLRSSHPLLVLPEENPVITKFVYYPTEITRTTNQRTEVPPTGVGVKYGLIYVQPKGLRSDTSEDFANLVLKLLNTNRKLRIDESFSPSVAVIPDIKFLLLPPSEQHSEIKALYESEPNTIIAIVDERGRSKQDIRFIRAELQKFGNRKLGAVVQCISKRDLEVRSGCPSHLPMGILQRINVMHGNTNFVVQSCPDLQSDKKLMIVGAHISHPSSGAATSCPSVASIVGSVDEDLMHYPGSARLQPTLKATFWRENRNLAKIKYEVYSQIQDLKSMMVERIEAWINKQGDLYAPHIVFYRHSNITFDKKLISEEIEEIQRACDQFPDWKHGYMTFSYLLVNKNAHIHSPYQNRDKETAHRKFTLANPGEKAAGHKYQYHVQQIPGHDDIFSTDHHQHLTRHLNSNYQLGKNDSIAIALPVHFAQKLAKRMYDYFHFAVTNKYDNLSSILRRLEYPEAQAAENDKQMTEMMNEYLLGYGNAQAGRGGYEIPPPVRKHPWLECLNEKMFYL